MQAPHDEAMNGVSQTIEEIRIRLDVIVQEEQTHYEKAKAERDRLVVVEEPGPFYNVVYREERNIDVGAYRGMPGRFSDEEWERLVRYEQDAKSLNPLARSGARRAKTALLQACEQREREVKRKALEHFYREDMPRLRKEHEEAEQQYETYKTTALLREEAIDNTDRVLRCVIPTLEEQLEMIERCGVMIVEGLDEGASLEKIRAAVSRYHQSIPEEIRKSVEEERLREQLTELSWERGDLDMW